MINTANSKGHSSKNPLKALKFPPVLFVLVIITAFVIVYAYDYLNQPPSTPQPTEESPVRVITLIAMEASDMTTYGFNGTVGGPTITLKKGETVKIILVNEGILVHDFTLKEEAYDVTTGPVSPDEKGEVTFTAHTVGDFTYFCSIFGHRQRGMEGKLKVTE
jgi:nitrite reductase (NO-forming)